MVEGGNLNEKEMFCNVNGGSNCCNVHSWMSTRQSTVFPWKSNSSSVLIPNLMQSTTPMILLYLCYLNY